MYPYNLGYHLIAKELCRIPKFYIPEGTIKIVRFKGDWEGNLVKVNLGKRYYNYYPYKNNGELKLEYFGIPRWSDINTRLGIKTYTLDYIIINNNIYKTDEL